MANRFDRLINSGSRELREGSAKLARGRRRWSTNKFITVKNTLQTDNKRV